MSETANTTVGTPKGLAPKSETMPRQGKGTGDCDGRANALPWVEAEQESRKNSGTRMNATEELRELVAERVRAVQTKDVSAIRTRPADDVITFDVLPPLNSRGSVGVVEHMQQWFDGYDGPIDFTVRDLHIDTDGNLGFCSFLYHVGGTLKAGGQVDMWVRATLCCRRIDSRWRIIHDHESVPFDPVTGRAQISLPPEVENRP